MVKNSLRCPQAFLGIFMEGSLIDSRRRPGSTVSGIPEGDERKVRRDPGSWGCKNSCCERVGQRLDHAGEDNEHESEQTTSCLGLRKRVIQTRPCSTSSDFQGVYGT